jgi:diguanylate cyclase (GGDEF)-like protein
MGPKGIEPVIPPTSPEAKGLNTLSVDATGALSFWSGPGGKAIFQVDPVTLRVKQIAETPFSPTWSKVGDAGDLWSLHKDASGNQVWWRGPQGTAAFDIPATVANEWVFPITRTNDGAMWIGTYNGLIALRNGRCSTFSADAGVPAGEVQATCQTHDGTIWIATLTKQVGTLVNGRFTLSPDPHLQTADVSSMAEDTRGVLWISTKDGHLWRCERGKSEDWRARLSGVDPKAPVATLAADGAGGLWAAVGGRIAVIRDGAVTPLPASDPNSPVSVVFCLLPVGDGACWIGGYKGAAYFDGKAYHYYGPELGLPSVPVLDVCKDHTGSVWIAYWGGGIARVKDGKVTQITLRDGLYADSVHSIVEDDHDQLWFGSSNGIFSISRTELDAYANTVQTDPSVRATGLKAVCHSYGTGEGALAGQSAAARQPIAFKALDGSLWFACIHGVVRASAEAPAITAGSLLPVHIESAKIDGTVFDSGKMASARPGQGNVEIGYTAICFENPEGLRFRYKLDGLDKGWGDPVSRRIAYYTNVPPGLYRFRVIALDGDGRAVSSAATFTFRVQPHYYETAWFRALCLLALVVLGVGLNQIRIRRLQVLNRTLEAKVEQRTQELEDSHRQLMDSREELQLHFEELQALQTELEVNNESLAEANARLENLATIDGLTGLKNHRAFQERLEQEMRGSARYLTPLSLILMDVDAFKAYNDTFGHPAGDGVLKQVAAILSSTARVTDLVARYGGEEFVVVLPQTDAAGALDLAERMRVAIESATWPNRPVTASFGVASLSSKVTTATEIIANADTALYVSKHHGRNRVTAHAMLKAAPAA